LVSDDVDKVGEVKNEDEERFTAAPDEELTAAFSQIDQARADAPALYKDEDINYIRQYQANEEIIETFLAQIPSDETTIDPNLGNENREARTTKHYNVKSLSKNILKKKIMAVSNRGVHRRRR
jgi:hypothetical protein